ncbi:MAG: L-asparaginase [Frankiales bacterium]|nr:L-asparaginase [Frankiales bacterium]
MTDRFISLLAMGGTISTAAAEDGAVPTRSADELAATLAGQTGIRVLPRDIERISSPAVTPLHMWELACAVREEIDGGAAGIVITHGTDTMEETTYALALLLETPVPVVLTGAMRPPHAPGHDGPGNLAAALATASEPGMAAYGPVVVQQDEVHAARWVTKLFSTRIAAFASPAAGPVALVSEGRVVPLLGPPPAIDRLGSVAPPTRRVELLWVAAGMDSLLVDALPDAVDALVVAGTGGGHVPPALARGLIDVVRGGRPVVLSSRCAAGEVLRSTYGGEGSERHLLSSGLVSAGSLSPLKARLRLLFGLSAGLEVDPIFAPEVV